MRSRVEWLTLKRREFSTPQGCVRPRCSLHLCMLEPFFKRECGILRIVALNHSEVRGDGLVLRLPSPFQPQVRTNVAAAVTAYATACGSKVRVPVMRSCPELIGECCSFVGRRFFAALVIDDPSWGATEVLLDSGVAEEYKQVQTLLGGESSTVLTAKSATLCCGESSSCW